MPASPPLSNPFPPSPYCLLSMTHTWHLIANRPIRPLVRTEPHGCDGSLAMRIGGTKSVLTL